MNYSILLFHTMFEKQNMKILLYLKFLSILSCSNTIGIGFESKCDHPLAVSTWANCLAQFPYQ